MNILLVCPECPETFWSFKHALRIISRRALLPPLGLLTVAAMLPDTWPKKLVAMGVRPLRDKDIAWADYVFLGAMRIHKDSVDEWHCREFSALRAHRRPAGQEENAVALGSARKSCSGPPERYHVFGLP